MFRQEFLARVTIAVGRPVTPDMLEWALRQGYVDRPPKRGGRGWYDETHLRQMLKYLEERGRFVSPEVDKIIADAEKVGKPLRKASDIEAANNE